MPTTHRTLLVLAGLGIFAGAARADRLDENLHKEMPAVLKKLKDNYKSAGVLRFRVQEGAAAPSYTSPLSGRMVERLETWLMVHNGADEAKALQLVHDVGAVAGRHGVESAKTEAERKKYFQHRYPGAWGQGELTPDVLLTGSVELSQDRRRTTVTLRTFDRLTPRLERTLHAFTFETDADVIRDLGYSVALSRPARKRLIAARDAAGRGVGDDGQVIIDTLNEALPVKAAPAKGGAAAPAKKPAAGAVSPDNIGGVSLTLLVGGAKKASQRIRPSVADGDGVGFEVMCPKAKEKVSFRLENKSDEELGVVLRLNGVNTLFEQTNPPDEAAKYRLAKKSSLEVAGFRQLVEEGKEELMARGGLLRTFVTPFRVLSEAEAAKFGNGKGLIDVDVYADAPGKGSDKVVVSGRGLPPSKEKVARQSYQGLRSALLKSAGLKSEVKEVVVAGKIVRREFFGPDVAKKSAGGDVERKDFENPVCVARVTIKVIPNDDLGSD